MSRDRMSEMLLNSKMYVIERTLLTTHYSQIFEIRISVKICNQRNFSVKLRIACGPKGRIKVK